MSINGWMDKEDVIHTHAHTHVYIIEYYPAMRKKKNVSFDNMVSSWGHSVKWNKPDGEKTLHSIIHMWNLKIKVKHIETENRKVIARNWEIRGELGKMVHTLSDKMNKV